MSNEIESSRSNDILSSKREATNPFKPHRNLKSDVDASGETPHQEARKLGDSRGLDSALKVETLSVYPLVLLRQKLSVELLLSTLGPTASHKNGTAQDWRL